MLSRSTQLCLKFHIFPPGREQDRLSGDAGRWMCTEKERREGQRHVYHLPFFWYMFAFSSFLPFTPLSLGIWSAVSVAPIITLNPLGAIITALMDTSLRDSSLTSSLFLLKSLSFPLRLLSSLWALCCCVAETQPDWKRFRRPAAGWRTDRRSETIKVWSVIKLV